ncbi:MAG: hypothetical protein ABIG28_00440 [archaeon]
MDVELTGNKKKEVINLLKRTKFENFKVDKHYFNKFGLPRHGINLEKAKEVYNQFGKIFCIFTRLGLPGMKYSVVYRINKKSSYYLIFLLDEKPKRFFNAIPTGQYIEKRIFKKFGF